MNAPGGIAGLAALLMLAGCERDIHRLRSEPSGSIPAEQAKGPLAAPEHYTGNALAVSQGQQLYDDFNCGGCHAHGGGSIGPSFMGSHWRYGGTLDAIHASIVHGRPNGMPAFGGRITADQSWELSAYVLSMGGHLRFDVAPNRQDHMQVRPTEAATKPAP